MPHPPVVTETSGKHKFDFAHLADAIIREKEECEAVRHRREEETMPRHSAQVSSSSPSSPPRAPVLPRVHARGALGPAAMAAAAAAAAAQYHGGFR